MRLNIIVALLGATASAVVCLSSVVHAAAHYVGEDDPTLKNDVYAVAVHNTREKCLAGDDEACVKMSYITNILWMSSPAPGSGAAPPGRPSTNCATIYDSGMAFTRCY